MPAHQPTRIGILATAQRRNGGALPYTFSMIEALRRMPVDRYELTIFTTTDNRHYDYLHLPVVKLPEVTKLVAARILRRDPFEAVDKVVAPVYSSILLATRRPFAFTLHDLQEKHFPQHFDLMTRVWRHVMNRLLTARADQIICESRYVKDDIVRHFATPASRISVVPAPPIAAFGSGTLNHSTATALRAKFNLPSIYVFYPAQFWPHKNHLRLIEAFARVRERHPECGLVLTGQKRFNYHKVFESAARFNIVERVFHVGHVSEEELSALYCGATVVAIPTLFESISLPVYEAFSLGTAACASSVAALPEQVGDAGLLFDPFSTNDIAEKICALLVDAPLRQQLIERGRKRVASLTHDAYARSLSAVIDAI